eukprot:1591014-Rhodomonas_salina.1
MGAAVGGFPVGTCDASPMSSVRNLHWHCICGGATRRLTFPTARGKNTLSESDPRSVLLVGDGDFSFAVALDRISRSAVKKVSTRAHSFAVAVTPRP